jgi:hypothetical protein
MGLPWSEPHLGGSPLVSIDLDGFVAVPPHDDFTRGVEDPFGESETERTVVAMGEEKLSKMDQAIVAAAAGLNELQCETTDPYGIEPTVMKVAVFIHLTSLVVAFMVIMRNIFILRLIGMFLSGPIPAFLLNMRDILDQLSVKKFDVSFNTMPFPVTTSGGTEIPAGLKIDIVELNIFGLVMVRRCYMVFQYWPPLFEAHIFVDPIEFKVLGLILLRVVGLQGPSRAEAFQKQAIAEKERAKANELELAKVAAREAGLMGSGGQGYSATVCGNDECYTCARSAEHLGALALQLECGSPSSVIGRVADAQWGVSSDQPMYKFVSTPGFCAGNGTANGSALKIPTSNWRSRVPTDELIESLERHCLGSKTCNVALSREELGVPEGVAMDDFSTSMALTVVIGCMSSDRYTVLHADKIIEGYGTKCADGCLSCAQFTDADAGGDTSGNLTIGCAADGIIVDIVDAAYGVEDEQPPWDFNPEAGMCLVRSLKVPTGGMRRLPTEAVKTALRRRCLGRQTCSFSSTELKARIDALQLPDAAAGKSKALSVIAMCKKAQIPLSISSSPPEPNTFGFVLMESRRLSTSNAAVSLTDSFQLRTAFQTSPFTFRSEYVKNATGIVWGREQRSSRGSMQKIHRIMASFTVADEQGEGDAGSRSTWRFRVTGRKFWKSGGGSLSITDAHFSHDYCGTDGVGCPLPGCNDGKHDFCDFDVALPGNRVYVVSVFGVSRAEKPGAKISIEYKPPSACVFMDGCANPTDKEGCKELSRKAMPYHTIAPGSMPWFKCKAPFLAELTDILVETKPFCMRPGDYADVSDCWPDISGTPILGGEENSKENDGCEGFHDASKVSWGSSGVMFARRHAAARSAGVASVVLDDKGGCKTLINPNAIPPTLESFNSTPSATAMHVGLGGEDGSTTANLLDTDLVGKLLFEEGPCEPRAGAPDLNYSNPVHAERCTGVLYTGAGSSPYAATFTYDVAPETVVTESLQVDESGVDFFSAENPHSGNFAAMFGGGADARRSVAAMVLPRIAIPLKGIPASGAAASYGMWYRKIGAIALGGETIMSWSSVDFFAGKSGGKVTASKKKISLKDPDATSVYLSSDSRLHFMHVEDATKLVLDKSTLDEVVGPARVVTCTGNTPEVPHLADGSWRHFSVVIEAATRDVIDDEVVSALTFYIDGASFQIVLECREMANPRAHEASSSGSTELGGRPRRNKDMVRVFSNRANVIYVNTCTDTNAFGLTA